MVTARAPSRSVTSRLISPLLRLRVSFPLQIADFLTGSLGPPSLPPSPSFQSTTDAAGCSTPTMSSPLRCRHFPIAPYRLLLWYPACLSRHLRCCNRYISRGSSHFYPFWSHSPSLNIVQSKHQKPLTQLFRIFSLNYLTQEGSFVLSL